MRLKEILFPTDFSAASEAAGPVARELALVSGARLHVLHVVSPVTDPAQGAERLGRVARSLGDGLAVSTAVVTGRAAHQILDYARDKGIDMIVLGSHGRTGVSYAILGSVAETVVRLAPCLVLTVPPAVLERRAAPAPQAGLPAARRCLVCAAETEDLICESCRTRIRGEALERKIEAERRGRRGSPA